MADAHAQSIQFRCPACGQLLRVPDGMQGGQVKCPKCGKAVPVPNVKRGVKPPPPKKAAPAEIARPPVREAPKYRRRRNPKAVKQFSVASSLFLLASLALPWSLVPGENTFVVVTSWHLIASGDFMLIFYQSGLWLFGFTAFIVALTTPALARSLVHICIGGATVLGAATFVSVLALLSGQPELLTLVFGVTLFIAMLVLGHTRVAVTGGKGLRIALGVVVNLFMLMQLLIGLQMVIHFSELARKPMLIDVDPASLTVLPITLAALPLVFVLGFLAAGGLMFFDSVRRKKKFTRHGLVLCYCVLFGLLIYLLVSITMISGFGGVVLILLNFGFIAVGCTGLLGTGIVELVLQLAERKNRPVEQDADAPKATAKQSAQPGVKPN